MSSIYVQKYGGTSLATIHHIKQVAKKIKSYYNQGKAIVVVVSAIGKTTDELIVMANQINLSPSTREMDVLLSTGEQVSISLLSLALHAISVPAVSFTGLQAGILTNGKYSNARIKHIDVKTLLNAISNNKVCIVAGFQGGNEKGDIMTLGRGGSDTSAVALAVALKSKECEIFTDVKGVYTADPNRVLHAKKLKQISYDEMLELSTLGVGVLHSRAVEFGKKYGVTIHVRSSFSEEKGTIVLPETHMMEQLLVTGVSLKTDEARISVTKVSDRPGIAAELFARLAESDINVDMIAQSTGENQLNTISFTIPENDLSLTEEIMQKQIDSWNQGSINIKKNIAILSVVGIGMKSHAGVAARMFNILAKNRINIEMISTSEIKISCVIDKSKGEQALQLVHDSLFEFME